MRLWDGTLRFCSLAGLLVMALGSGGCSFSYQLGSLFEKDGNARPEHTSAVRATAMSALAADQLPPADDLVYTRAVVAEVMVRGGKDASSPWENPRTGARGSVTALESVRNENNATCRDFIASYVRDGSEAWMQGEACRPQNGQWEVRSMRPWKRS